MLLITNGTIATPSEFLEGGAVYIEKGIIKDIGLSSSLQKTYKNARVLDAGGSLVMPGFSNVHTHLYSTFARGMSVPGKPASNFVEILQNLWWRLDKTLSEEDVYYSAMIPLIECVKNGTTTIIDHHASPSFVRGSLDKIGEALKIIPVRASLCYEVSDRDGKKVTEAGLEENSRFIKKHLGGELLTAMFGLHASFTVSNETITRAADIARGLKCGFHIHVAEDRADLIDAQKKYGMGVVERLNTMGILGNKTMLAHCIHISEREMDILAETKTNVAHNPESNMNNAVGAADIVKMLKKGVNVGLGTDGMTHDMFQEAKFAHLLRKHVMADPGSGFSEAGQLLFENNRRILANFFKNPVGRIEKGAYADIVVLDYNPPTPLTHENFLGHFLYGMNSSLVKTTIVNGKILMQDRKLVGVDEAEIAAKSRELALKLWKRI